jgi:hypothetical protein
MIMKTPVNARTFLLPWISIHTNEDTMHKSTTLVVAF